MADWNKPTITSGYINFVDELNTKFVDAGTMQFNVGTNIPLQTMRWNRITNTFQEWLGPVSGWQNKVIAVLGGGTGATTPAGIVANLGLGSMSTQNSNAVNITGGTISGVNFDVTSASGILPLARGGTGASLALGYAGSVLMSNGTQTQYMSGGNITEINASNITQGVLPLARLTGLPIGVLNANNTWTGQNIFDGAESLALTSQWQYAIINMYSYSAAVDKKRVRLIYNGGIFSIATVNDSYNATIRSLISIDNDGTINGNGGGITNLNAYNLSYGYVPAARLGGGPANNTTFLRGDGVWAVPPTGSAPADPIPSGLIAVFDTGCPSGWTRVTGMDNKFIIGSGSYGLTGGADTHRHRFNAGTAGAGSHSHGFSGSISGNAIGRTSIGSGSATNVVIGSNPVAAMDHGHDVNVSVSGSASGSTDGVGNHAHTVDDYTESVAHTPPYFSVVFCRKN